MTSRDLTSGVRKTGAPVHGAGAGTGAGAGAPTAGGRRRDRGGALRALGPGILFAGAAIGGSHLVQSTRAGAGWGFALVWVVVLAMVFKYPFFEFSHRYTAATGESLLHGYRRLGLWALALFTVIVMVSSFITTAAVTLVTAGLAGALLQLTWPVEWLSAGVLLVVGAILGLGRYRTLDVVMKAMVAVLAVLTLVAVSVAAVHGPAGDPQFVRPPLWTGAGIAFLLALMGWMPTPVDVAVWPSLWRLEKERTTHHHASVREALVDFHVGYVTTGVLALAFLSFGALLMFGTGEALSGAGVPFCNQLVSMYTAALGEWSRWIIALVAFITMFSTTLTVCDGYTRTLEGCWALLRRRPDELDAPVTAGRRLYGWLLPALMLSGLAVIVFFMSGLTALMDVATILAFLTGPFVAALNVAVMRSRRMPAADRPPRWLRWLAVAGIVYLAGFSVVFLVLQLRG
ncbi:MAG: Nramp family divalent metal transporter [Candidatus Krumholzibacteriia bacterium]